MLAPALRPRTGGSPSGPSRWRGAPSWSSPSGGIGKNLVYYWGPTELRAAGDKAVGATIRLGGLVGPGSIVSAEGVSSLEFDVIDRQGASVHVKATGVPPQLFRERIGVVVEGTMTRAGHFEGSRLMVSHSNEYRAPGDQERGRQGADAHDRGTQGRPRRRRTPVIPRLGRSLILLALLVAVARRDGGLRRRAPPIRGGRALWTRRFAYAFAAAMAARQRAHGLRAAHPRLLA